MTRTKRTPALHDHRDFIPDDSPVITEASWEMRNELERRYYPQIMPLLAFGELRLINVLIDVESPRRPPRELFVGVPGDRRPMGCLPRRSWLEWSLFRGVAPAARRPDVPVGVRRAVLARDGMVCQLCHRPIDDPADVHLDHVQPYSLGGGATVKNLQVTHGLCNMRKGATWLASTPV